MSKETKQLTTKDYFESIKGDLQPLMKHDLSGFINSAKMLMSENTALLACMNSKEGQISLYRALKRAASVGLSLNPQEGKACLIAYKDSVSYQIMKNGLIELALNTGKVKFITCETVREKDQFEMRKTIDGDSYNFIPERKDRGGIDGFFAAVKLTDDTSHVKYMTKAEVEEIRDNYSSMYKYKKEQSPWHKSFEGMGLKTVLKALFRTLTVDSEMVTINADDEPEINITGESFDDKAVTPEQLGNAVKQKNQETQTAAPKLNNESEGNEDQQQDADNNDNELDIF